MYGKTSSDKYKPPKFIWVAAMPQLKSVAILLTDLELFFDINWYWSTILQRNYGGIAVFWSPRLERQIGKEPLENKCNKKTIGITNTECLCHFPSHFCFWSFSFLWLLLIFYTSPSWIHRIAFWFSQFISMPVHMVSFLLCHVPGFTLKWLKCFDLVSDHVLT